jgi:hypothetical protein
MNLCSITGRVVDSQGEGIDGVFVSATPSTYPAIIAGTSSAISPIPIETLTTSSGYFSINLIQGMEYTITVFELGYNQKILIPEQDTEVLWNLSSVDVSGDDNSTDW